ncbi:MAG: hypothetical protein WBA76_10390 [Phormidesmis sp.]
MARTKFGFAPTKTQKPATATQETAIATIDTSATEIVVLPINSDIKTAFTEFKARPFVAAVIAAFTKAKDGFLKVLDEEKENSYGLSFLQWLWGIFAAVVLPVLSLLWLALNKGYVWARKKETRAAASAKWQAVKDWAAPKYDYERPSEDDAAVEL